MLKFLSRSSLLALLQCALCCAYAAAQQPTHQLIVNEFDSARTNAPREKLYVHIDKSVYAQQDTLWFKGYLVNTTLNDYSTISGLIYAELINSAGEVVNRSALPTALGLTWGSFALKETTFPPGKYTFRAYTKWMQNFGNTYVFSREITIVGTELTTETTVGQNIRRNAMPKANISSVKINRGTDLQFLPEGGTWLQQAYQKMAFKIVNSAGKGFLVAGEIVDSKKQKVVDFKSNENGMGYFAMAPLENEKYVARFTIGNQVFERSLPEPKPTGTSLTVDLTTNPDSLTVTTFSTLENENLLILGQSRGILCFTANFRAGAKRKTFKVAKNLFPTGVSQILVVNNKRQTINERNFFLDLNDQLIISTSASNQTFANRDSIPIQIKVTDKEGRPVETSLSMAITDNGQVAKDEKRDPNILTDLLLTSDLKGKVENPGQYFDNGNPNRLADLDALLLTQGWVSYSWPADRKPVLKPEKEYSISGKVTNLTNKPVAAAKIVMLGKNKGFLTLDTITNANGEFVFNQLPVLDSASLLIQALNAKGKKGTLGIALNEFVSPPVSNVKDIFDQLDSSDVDSVTRQFIAAKKQTQEAAIRSGIVLREVKIVGKRSIKGSKNLHGSGEASQTLTESQLEPVAKRTLLDVLLTKVKGFRSGTRKGGQIQDFLINFDLARFVFDGIELDFFYTPSGGPSYNDYYQFVKSYLDYYIAEDIVGIETMENGLSWRYRSEFKEPMDQTSYAFIEITTKSGSGPFLKKAANMYLLKPVNYGDTKTFYHPKYTSQNKTNSIPDFRSTLYWNPNITTDQNGNANITFYSSDKKGTYTVWVEGTDTKGGLGMRTMKIEIK